MNADQIRVHPRKPAAYYIISFLDSITTRQSIHASVPEGAHALYARLVDEAGGALYARVSGGEREDDVS
jgi:hypothetical protein